MDHEFGSSALRENQQGWDWFSIQLDNDAEVMLYVIRRTDGTPDVTSSGSLITSEGNVIPIRRDQMRITPLARWKSKKSGATYPHGLARRAPLVRRRAHPPAAAERAGARHAQARRRSPTGKAPSTSPAPSAASPCEGRATWR